ncbi:hypothetical protein GCM10010123_26920 [Pilimelia anulata]|uniref:Uncharacterized protein n=2 Tax=Pilimelia anulata TaxID=53371 RepID=A0A8J3B4U1_9ACTN|nr:hypothetical protein GCM10010123_26920 [Pilimelia anulata]
MLRYGVAGALTVGTGTFGLERATRGEAATIRLPDLRAAGLRAVTGEVSRLLGRVLVVARYADAVGRTLEKAFIDGVELHLMPYVKGGWVSSVCHYDPRPTVTAAARLAVERLDGLPLLPLPAHEH